MLESTHRQLGVLSQDPVNIALELHSIRASFGRAVVADKLTAEDLTVWETGLKSSANDHRYYELTYEVLQNQFSHYYLLLKDASDTTRAIQPFFVVNVDITMGMPNLITRTVDRLRKRFRSALKFPILMVGCSAGEGHIAETHGTADEAWVVRSLGEVLPAIARELKTELVVFKDFPKLNRAKLNRLHGFGFRRISSMPATKIELKYKDFDDYFNTVLSAKMRKDLRRKFRRTASESPITMEVIKDITPHLDEVFPLYEQVVKRSKLKFEILTKSYFSGLGKKMSDKALFFIWRQEGRILAFNSCITHNGVLRDNYVGFDYTVALEYHLYFITRRDLFSWIIKNGFHTYYSAPLNYDPKLHLKQTLSPLDLYVRTTRGWVNPLFRFVLPLMDPTRYDPIIKKFANASELNDGS